MTSCKVVLVDFRVLGSDTRPFIGFLAPPGPFFLPREARKAEYRDGQMAQMTPKIVFFCFLLKCFGGYLGGVLGHFRHFRHV